MKKGKRFLSMLLVCALFLTQGGGITFAGAVGRGVSQTASVLSKTVASASGALQRAAEAVGETYRTLSDGLVARAAITYTLVPDTNITVIFDPASGKITKFNAAYNELNTHAVIVPEKINGVDVTAIGADALSDITNLKQIKAYEEIDETMEELATLYLPNSLQTIEERAFAGLTSLTTLELPAGLQKIEDDAFRICGMTEVSIPASVQFVGNGAFSGCEQLTSVSLAEWAKGAEMSNSVFSDCSALTTVILNDNITGINDYMFRDCTSLQNITIPNSVTEIGSNAFEGCTELHKIAFSNQLSSLGYHAFYGCTSLEEISIPASVTTLESYAFADCTGLKRVVYAASVEYPADYIFSGCSGLETLEIASGVMRIGKSMFANCSALQSIAIPDSVTVIYNNAFEGCSELASATLPNALLILPNNVFKNCVSLRNIEISDNVETIGQNAFSGCASLQTVTIPANVRFIESDAFANSGLTSVTLEDGLEELGEYMFYGCENLTSVNIPGTVEKIEAGAFQNCTGLESITLHDGSKTLWIHEYAFSGCTSLKSITLPARAQIGQYLFEGCEKLQSVDLQNTALNNIPKGTFSGCIALTNITPLQNVITVNESAFENCISLTDIAFPDTLQYIEQSAFRGCSSLTQVDIPASVSSIDSVAFADCTNLSSAIIRGNNVTFGENYYDSWQDPKGKHIFYQAADGFTIYGLVGSTAQTYAEEHEIPFVTIDSTETRTLSVVVKTSDGNAVTEGITVNWYEGDSETPISGVTGTTLANAKKDQSYAAEIVLGAELAAAYQQPARQIIEAGDEDAEITFMLQPVVKLNLTGSVQNSEGNVIPNATVTITQASLTEPVVVQVSNGDFAVAILAADMQIQVSADGYYSKRFSVCPDAEAVEYDLGAITLYETVADRISLELNVQHAALPDETAQSSTLYDASGLNFTLTGAGGRSITGFEVQGTTIVFLPGAVEAKEQIVIAVSDSQGRYDNAICSVTLDENRIGSAQITLIENGSFLLDSMNTNNARLLIFGADGMLVESLDAYPSMQSAPMQTGTYTLVFLQKDSMLPSVSTLERLEALQVEYAVVRGLSITVGTVCELTNISVPDLQLEQLIRTSEEGTGVSASTQTPAQGTQFYIRAEYALADSENSRAVSMKLALPEEMQIVNSRVFFNGIVTPYSADSELTIPLNGQNAGTAIVYCTAETTGECDVNAYLLFDDDVVQPIGTVHLTVGEADINLPEKTACAMLPITGTALPNSTITVYDKDTVLGTATANAAGSWALNASLDPDTLYNYSYHNIYAVIESGNLCFSTDSKLLIYDKVACTLSKITMYNTYNVNGVIGTGETVMDFTSASTVQPFYYYCPNFMDFVFRVEFSGDASVLDTVTVVTEGQNGEIVQIPATYDIITGTWIAVYAYNTNNVPVSVGATYEGGESSIGQFDEDKFLDYANLRLQTMNTMQDMVTTTISVAQEGSEESAAADILYNITENTDSAVAFSMKFAEGDTLADYRIETETTTCTKEELIAEDYIALDQTDRYFGKIEYRDDSIVYICVGDGNKVTVTLSLPNAITEDVNTISFPIQTAFNGPTTYTLDYAYDEWFQNWYDITQQYQWVYKEITAILPKVGDSLGWAQTIADLTVNNSQLLEVLGNIEIFQQSLDKLNKLINEKCADGSRRLTEEEYQQFLGIIIELRAAIVGYYALCDAMIKLDMMVVIVQSVVNSVLDSTQRVFNFSSMLYAIYSRIMFTSLYVIEPEIVEWTATGDADYELLRGPIFQLNFSLPLEEFIGGGYIMLDDVITNLGIDIRQSLLQKHCTDDGDSGGLGDWWNDGNTGLLDGSTIQTQELLPIYDPTGFVYEAVPSNRLDGVTAVVYQQGSDDAWNAADYDQINPQITDATGMFAWYVPDGDWKILFTKSGYQTADSSSVAAASENDGWLPVPPPQFDVNVGMVSQAAPEVEQAVAYPDRVELTFSQYMNIGSVAQAVSFTRDGSAVPVTVQALDAEATLDGSTTYATRFAVIPADKDYTGIIMVSTDAKNYADTALNTPYSSELIKTVPRPTGFSVSGQTAVVCGDKATMTVTLQPGIAGVQVQVENLSPALLSIPQENMQTDENGVVALVLSGLLPGEAVLRLTEAVSGVTETVTVPIVRSADDLPTAEKPTAVVATLADGSIVKDGMEVESGTFITLQSSTAGAEIRYTLNDTCPCKEDALHYEAPIPIEQDTVLRAAACKDGVYSDTIRLELNVAAVSPEEPNPGDTGGASTGSGDSASDNKPSASVSGSGGKVTVGNDGTVTITPDEGYQIAKITVNGKEVEIPANSKLTGLDKGDKVVVAFEKVPVEEQPDTSAMPFTDVAPGAWYAGAVQYVYEKGMMNGTDEISFSPDETTTRGMIVTILHRLEGEPTAVASGFTDVMADAWYADAVAWAAANGVVKGISETSFAPENPITREQLAAILYRYAQLKGYDVSVGEDTDIMSYTDAGQISEYAIPAMHWANAESLITGNTATTLNPMGQATRAEVATILMRFCESFA